MNYQKILPDYPRTPHLVYKPNAQRADLITKEQECQIIFTCDETYLEEKIDGASLGICYWEGSPIIRNRNNFLQKGKTGHLRTPAKLQFAYVWNWFYENIHKFQELNNLAGYEVSVYGEWLLATHSCRYNNLPSYFIAYDLYDWEKCQFINTGKARSLLACAGFELPPLLHRGKIENWEIFDKLCQELSVFSSTDIREGVYVKVCDVNFITNRFKIVRSGFIQGCHWSSRSLTKNKLANEEN